VIEMILLPALSSIVLSSSGDEMKLGDLLAD
jgi:hypothetical protein